MAQATAKAAEHRAAVEAGAAQVEAQVEQERTATQDLAGVAAKYKSTAADMGIEEEQSAEQLQRVNADLEKAGKSPVLQRYAALLAEARAASAAADAARAEAGVDEKEAARWAAIAQNTARQLAQTRARLAELGQEREFLEAGDARRREDEGALEQLGRRARSAAQWAARASAGFAVVTAQTLPGHIMQHTAALMELRDRAEQDSKTKLKAATARQGGFSAGDLKQVGYALAELKQGGYTAAQLRRDGGFTAAELHQGGFTPAELKEGGCSAGELRDGGLVALAQLKVAGFTAAQLKQGGCELLAMRLSALYTPRELQQGGFALPRDLGTRDAWPTRAELQAEGFSEEEIQSAKYASTTRHTGFWPPPGYDGSQATIGYWSCCGCASRNSVYCKCR
jgi:hypothetical protein